MCVVVGGGARCENCQVKHYGCLLMPAKKVVGGRGGPSGSQQAKVVAGSQTKRKGRKPVTLGKLLTCCHFVTSKHMPQSLAKVS